MGMQTPLVEACPTCRPALPPTVPLLSSVSQPSRLRALLLRSSRVLTLEQNVPQGV